MNNTEQFLKNRLHPNPTFINKILSAIDANNKPTLKKLIIDLHNADIAYIISELNAENRKYFIKAIASSFTPEILTEIEDSLRQEIIKLLGYTKTANLINKMSIENAVYVTEELDANILNKITNKLSATRKSELMISLAYPEDSVGRIMNKNFISISHTWNVGQVIDYLRELPKTRNFYEILIVNSNHKPMGTVLASQILQNNRDCALQNIMSDDMQVFHTSKDQEEVALLFRKYGLISAPVISESGRLVGIIEIDDIVEIVHEEAEEDILQMAGVGEIDINSNIITTTISRFPWLFGSLITSFLTAFVISFFATTIEQFVILAILMPIIAAIAANGGTQSATVIIRNIAMRQLTKNNLFKLFSREIAVSILNGILLGAIFGLLAWFKFHDYNLSIVIIFSISISMFMAGIAGYAVPIMLERFGVDPAVSSGVLVTTISDIVAFSTFLGFATLVMG